MRNIMVYAFIVILMVLFAINFPRIIMFIINGGRF